MKDMIINARRLRRGVCSFRSGHHKLGEPQKLTGTNDNLQVSEYKQASSVVRKIYERYHNIGPFATGSLALQIRRPEIEKPKRYCSPGCGRLKPNIFQLSRSRSQKCEDDRDQQSPASAYDRVIGASDQETRD